MNKQVVVLLRMAVVVFCVGCLIRAAAEVQVEAAAPVMGGETTRVSVSSTGAEGDEHSSRPTLSSDGRYVAFTSSANTLVDDDTNACVPIYTQPTCSDVFVHDRTTGTTERVSVDGAGAQLEAHSYLGDISADGEWVTFVTTASLVTSDTNTVIDVYMKNRASGAVTWVSVGNEGAVDGGAMSDDAQWVVFGTDTGLAEGDTNNVSDIYLWHRETEEITRVSLSEDTAFPDTYSLSPDISEDGAWIAFVSNATDLVPDDTNNVPDVFVVERATGETTRVSVSTTGEEGDAESFLPTLSGDGQFVAFASYAELDHEQAGTALLGFFLHNRASGETRQVNIPLEVASFEEYTPLDLSGDGRYLLYGTNDRILSGAGTMWLTQYRYDRLTGETVYVALDYVSGTPAAVAWGGAISADGQAVAFDSSYNRVVPDDTNNKADVFVRSAIPMLPTPTPSATPTMTPTLAPFSLYLPLLVREERFETYPRFTTIATGGLGWFEAPHVSADGNVVAFLRATQEGSPDPDQPFDQVYVWERGHEVRMISTDPAGAPGNGDTLDMTLSDDGRWVVFSSWANTLTAGDTNGTPDVFRYDLHTDTMERVSVTADGGVGSGNSSQADVSADGRYVVFRSTASNLSNTPFPAACDPSPCATLYRRDMESDTTTAVIEVNGFALATLQTPQISANGEQVAFGWVKYVGQTYNGEAVYRPYVYHYHIPTGTLTELGNADNGVTPPCLASCYHNDLSGISLSPDGETVTWRRYAGEVSQYGGTTSLGREIRTVGSDARYLYLFTSSYYMQAQALGWESYQSAGFTQDGDVIFGVRDLRENPPDGGVTPVVADDTNNEEDIYRWNRADNTMTRLTDAPDGSLANGYSHSPDASPDGNYVVFVTTATNLMDITLPYGPEAIVMWEDR